MKEALSKANEGTLADAGGVAAQRAAVCQGLRKAAVGGDQGDGSCMRVRPCEGHHVRYDGLVCCLPGTCIDFMINICKPDVGFAGRHACCQTEQCPPCNMQMHAGS